MPATFVSSHEITCQAPAMKVPGRMTLSVTSNRFDFLKSSFVTVTFYKTPTILSADPPLGPIFGGTAVTVTGNDFGEGPIFCRFGRSLAVPATRLHDEALRCVTPDMSMLASQSLPVQVSRNLVDFATSSVKFMPHSPVVLEKLS